MTLRRARVPAAVVAASLAAAALAATAAGARGASPVGLSEASVSRFPDVALVVSLPRKQPLTAAQVDVKENGSPVANVSVAKPGAENFGVVLVVDASNSMAGAPIAGAMTAARAFAARRNPGQQLALVTFNGDTNVVLPLTTDPTAIEAALANTPKLAAGTHIYDALEAARVLLEDAGIAAGSIVLLSDGQDVGSKIDSTSAIEGLADSKTRVFAVGLRSGQYAPEALQKISAETAGTYAEASGTGALRQIYAGLGYTLSNEYLLRYRSLAGPDEPIRVAVKVKDIPGTARLTYRSPPLPTAAPTPTASSVDEIVRSTYTLLIVVLTVVCLLGYAVFRLVYRQDQMVTRRIGQFVTLPEDERAVQRQAEVTELLSSGAQRRRSGSGGRWQRFQDDMALARITTSPRTIALLTTAGGLALGVAVAIVIGSPIGLLAMIAAPFVTRTIVKRRLERVRAAFSDQLPDNLDVLTSGLRSGHSFVGALALCVDDAAEPSRTEFKRVVADEQLGVPIDEALHVAGQRMESRDVVQVALVAKLQREAGTNAADVLDQVSDNLRARRELARLVDTLTAQGRMARWIVSLLPVFLFLAIFVLNREYISPLWEDPVGIAGAIAATIMVVIGSLIIKRIIEIKV